ncbi:sulfatase [Candidatus Hydrogenedentota bacterium]
MNFIVIMCDTLRADHIGAYGPGLAKTPNLDKFAESATLFRDAYVGSWATVPNRTDLFTGRYGEPFHRWRPLSYTDVTMPEVFRKAGYATQLINDTPHLINYGFGFDRPFNCWWMIRGNEVDRCRTDHHAYEAGCRDDMRRADKWETQYRRNTRNRPDREQDRFSPQVMTAACNWLEDNYKNDGFFLWVDCFDPHEPFDPPQHYIDMYDPGYDGEVITNFFERENIKPREIKHIRARYAGMVTMVDTWVGKVLDKLETLGIADDTVVTICSDHGTGLGDHYHIHKHMPIYEENGHIVLMMRAPGTGNPGSHSGALAQPADLMPTLLGLAGLEADYNPQGKSLVQAFADPEFSPREVSISSMEPQVKGIRPVSVNDGEWTYVHNVLPESDELYHTKNDRAQKNNVIEQNPEVVERLRDAMFKHFEKVADTPDWILESYRARKDVQEIPPLTYEEERVREQSLRAENFYRSNLY